MRSVKGKRVAGTLSALAVASGSLTMALAGPAGATSSTSSTTVCPSVARLSGADRIATSIAISQGAFPATGSAKAVVLVQDLDIPDALSAGPLASDVDGPLLLTAPNQLSSDTLAEMTRVLPAGGTVILIGGTGALSAAVMSAVTSAGFQATRVSGANRFATAVAVANAINPTTVFEATGLVFADALAAGPAAVVKHAAILLTNGSVQAPETATYLAAHTSDARYAIGGPASAADPTATAVVGTDRFATAADVAQKFFTGVKAIGVVSGTDAPDALSAVPLLGPAGVPMLLVNPTGALPSSVSSYLTTDGSSILGVAAFGGDSVLSDSVLSEITADLPNFSNASLDSCSTTGGSTSSTSGGSTSSTSGGSTSSTAGGSTSSTAGGSTSSTAAGGGALGGGLGGLLSILSGLTGSSGTSGLGGISTILSGLLGSSSTTSGLTSLTSVLSGLTGGSSGAGGLPVVGGITGITSILTGLLGGTSSSGGLPVVGSL